MSASKAFPWLSEITHLWWICNSGTANDVLGIIASWKFYSPNIRVEARESITFRNFRISLVAVKIRKVNFLGEKQGLLAVWNWWTSKPHTVNKPILAGIVPNSSHSNSDPWPWTVWRIVNSIYSLHTGLVPPQGLESLTNFFFLILIFYCYSITVVCLFSPSLHPTPAKPPSLPHFHPPPWFCPYVLYSSSCNFIIN